MTLLLAGLVVFLGIHSVRIFADDWRTARVAAMGPLAWKAVHSVISIAGFALIVYGYGFAREAPVDLWNPPRFTRHLASLLTLPVFVLIAAAYVPGTHIKAALKHPMILGVKAWALAHLLSNGRLADVILFGAFLAWAILDYRAARKRDRQQGVTYRAESVVRDVAAVAIGLAAWAAFALVLHGPLIGVRPFG
ncbi:MAG TPA: NnrU family protein [Usitatibacteraceae bacterium]|nr:NnrU family protein [Usitatibacteraceae bacterium]